MIQLVDSKIDEAAILQSVKSDEAGACVLFSGTTRQFTGDKETTSLRYDGYRDMAIKQLEKLVADAAEKWPLIKSAIVHRLGEVPIGETSVVVAVSSQHRVDAFAAASWLMDTLKKDIPIWKKEHWIDGSQEWIHPDVKSTETAG